MDAGARQAAAELMSWDGGFAADSHAAALFLFLQPALYRALFGDELQEDLSALMSIAIVHYNALEEVMHSGRSSFWDDVDTPAEERPAQIWARALVEARDELVQRLPDPGSRRLDALRRLSFPHAFQRLPLLGDWFGIGPLPVGGDAHTINTMKTTPLEPEEARFIPSMRTVFTPADWGDSRITLPLGQSGHRFSPHRADQLEDWLAGRTHALPWGGPAPDDEIGVLTLSPEPQRRP
jgi:acyl-homoserine lactone acylase PvdQ